MKKFIELEKKTFTFNFFYINLFKYRIKRMLKNERAKHTIKW
jgi:hypothetical protein